MECFICKKSEDETNLFEGIYKGIIIDVCESCAADESIPLIRKPTKEQITLADQRVSVREKLERLSGYRRTGTPSPEQLRAQGNLAKLKATPDRRQSDAYVDNYFWELQIARRRKKITIEQLSEKTGVSTKIIESIEKGNPPKDSEEEINAIENFLEIKLLKKTPPRITFKKVEITSDLLKNAREDLEIRGILPKHTEEIELTEAEKKEKEITAKQISQGEFDFSKRNSASLKNVTLNDLIAMKKERENWEKAKKEKEERESEKKEHKDDDLLEEF